MRNAVLAAFVALAFAGCTVGPEFVKPDIDTAPAFDRLEPVAYRAGEPELAFWSQFGDATLERLVADALAGNHDLRIAFARLSQARALAREARLDFFPVATAGASYTDSRTPAAVTGLPGDGALERELHDAGFDAAWELDLFGRVRRASEAARAESRAAEADLGAARVSIAAEVARGYFELRGLQEQLRVARENVANQASSLDVVEVRLEAGSGTAFDSARQRAQLESTKARVPALEAAVAATIHRLGVLAGRQPQALREMLEPAAPLPALPDAIAVGTPETMLRRRPDIAAAEERLHAATARVGIATADLFPRVTLVGRYGSAAADAGDLGSGAAERWSFGPSISWAAFDLGRVRARIAASDAATEGALAAYEQTVLRALEETETSLVRYARKRREAEHLVAAATASGEAAGLARTRFDAGASDFLQVLDAERTQLEARDRAAQARTEAATALIAVYKALGGFPAPVSADVARTSPSPAPQGRVGEG